ncbi:sphingomyelin phosphodiesterase-like [Aphidius gifuensis]|nr:sphingomyelin phosphodiesterase-like [Aphidius gifuensis]
MHTLLIILIIFTTSCNSIYISAHDYNASLLTNELEQWTKTNQTSQTLSNLVDYFALSDDLQHHYWTKKTGPRDSENCLVCKSVLNTIMRLYREGVTIEEIQESTVKMCVLFNIYNEPVCRGMIKLLTPTFKYIFDNDKTVSSEDICGLTLQTSNCIPMPERFKWSINIDQGPLKHIKINSTNEQIKIIHLSDLHYDPKYEPFGAAKCGMPTCCRKGQKNVNDSNIIAGYWGDYNRCDTPWHAAVDTLDHAKENNQDVDIVYYTGDLVDHGEWETTIEGNREIVIKSFDQLKKTFGNISVYPILGNHEANPLNVFSSSNIKDDKVSTNWLYKLVADLWIDNGWLPESTRSTILQGGYYTVVHRTGFRIIGLNNNAGYTSNWWLVHEPRDIGGQLQWLENTLVEAEKNNEFVHILAHLPAGATECQFTWSRQYNRIINRFAHIIAGQFNGHTHNDEFNVFYDINDPSKPINVAWNGGSITAWAKLNPNYKVYKANANNYNIEENEAWTYNLTEANATPEQRPRWFRSYSFKDEYKLSDLSLMSLDSLLKRWCRDKPDDLKKYSKYFYKEAPDNGQCSGKCLDNLVCRIATTSTGDKTPCKHLKCQI